MKSNINDDLLARVQYVLDKVKIMIDNPDIVISSRYNIKNVCQEMDIDITGKLPRDIYVELENKVNNSPLRA